MKKVITLILVLALAFSVAACGSKTEDVAEAPASQTTDSAASAAEPAAPAAEPAAPQASEGVQQSVIPCATGEINRYATPTTGLTKADPTTLYIGEMIVVENINPGFTNSTACVDLVYDPMIRIDYETGELVGCVMSEWKLSDDAQSLEFTIPDNITFHNGDVANAEDVIYSLWRYAQSDLSPQCDTSTFSNIDFDKSVAVDDTHGVLYFKTPMINIVSSLLKSWLLNKDYIEEMGEDNAWWDNCCGTGPYKVEHIVQGDRYNLVRNDTYWKEGEMASFEKAVVRYYAEASTMYMDFESGALDVIINPLSTDVARVINGEVTDAVCDIYPSLQTFSIAFNEEKNPALADENVRKAISLAIDNNMVVKIAYDFLGVGSDSLFASGVKDALSVPHVQDIEGAKQALADAGYEPGELKIVFGTNTQNVNMALAEAVQAQLIEVGIDCEVITADPSTHIMNFRNQGNQTYDIASTLVTYATLDCAPFLTNTIKACGAMSFSAPTDEKVDELGTAIRSATDPAEKSALTLELQQYFLDHYWQVPIVKTKTALIYKSYLDGIHALTPRCPDMSDVFIVG